MSHLGPLKVFSIPVPSSNILGPNISHRGHCPEIVDINFPSPILMLQSKRIVPLTLQYFGHLTRNAIQREPYGPVAFVGIRVPTTVPAYFRWKPFACSINQRSVRLLNLCVLLGVRFLVCSWFATTNPSFYAHPRFLLRHFRWRCESAHQQGTSMRTQYPPGRRPGKVIVRRNSNQHTSLFPQNVFKICVCLLAAACASQCIQPRMRRLHGGCESFAGIAQGGGLYGSEGWGCTVRLQKGLPETVAVCSFVQFCNPQTGDGEPVNGSVRWNDPDFRAQTQRLVRLCQKVLFNWSIRRPRPDGPGLASQAVWYRCTEMITPFAVPPLSTVHFPRTNCVQCVHSCFSWMCLFSLYNKAHSLALPLC